MWVELDEEEFQWAVVKDPIANTVLGLNSFDDIKI